MQPSLRAHRLCWSFGEPEEKEGALVVPFYYQTGRHTLIRLPWPTPRFSAAGGLHIRLGGGAGAPSSSASAIELGRILYQALGAEAQKTLIQAFANRDAPDTPRVLLLQFPTSLSPTDEITLALEDLPWELMHDGEDFIAWHYNLQIVRSHVRDPYQIPQRVWLNSWRILLVTPFVFSSTDEYAQAGLEPLPVAEVEARELRQMNTQTRGMVHVLPGSSRQSKQIRTFEDFESALRSSVRNPYQAVHFTGHGMVYEEEPCLCFEDGAGGVTYVSVARVRRLLLSIRDESGPEALPRVLFLNACSASRRGRYSTGFAAGLQDVGVTVVGYQSQIPDDERPRMAAEKFYRSLCMEQSLESPHRPPNLITAIDVARRQLRGAERETQPVWGRLRAYLPRPVDFHVEGRGALERSIQRLYSRIAQWMNPADLTDHLSVGFIIALMFGALLGLQNLAFVLPESVWQRHLTYSEILSELIRVFLVGPLSFLAAAIPIAGQTYVLHKFLRERDVGPSLWQWIPFFLQSLFFSLCSGVLFAVLFSYSFSRLDLLTSETVILAVEYPVSVEVFWYAWVGALGGMLALVMHASNGINGLFRQSLYSYRTYYVLMAMLAGFFAVLFVLMFQIEWPELDTKEVWNFGAIIILTGYAALVTKFIKETSWRAEKRQLVAPTITWRKVIPLLSALAIVLLSYFLLELTARFQQQTIQTAMEQRMQMAEPAYDDRTSAILQRALRQRVQFNVSQSLRYAASIDWLLSVVLADALVGEARQERNPVLQRGLLEESDEALQFAVEQNPEVQFIDYWANIDAMRMLTLSTIVDDPSRKIELLRNARSRALQAVKKENRNFAYLDTQARVEHELGRLEEDVTLLENAQQITRRAKWSAFFLRSPVADAVRASIDALEQDIDAALEDIRSGYSIHNEERAGFPVSPIEP